MNGILHMFCFAACCYSATYAQGQVKKPVYGLNLYALNGEFEVDLYARNRLKFKERVILNGPQFGASRLKGRLYQEVIFGGITRSSDRSYDRNYDSTGHLAFSTTDYETKSLFNLNLNYQVGWKWLGKEDGGFALISGLGVNFIYGKYKRTSQSGELMVSQHDWNSFVYMPHVFSTLTYSLNNHWGMNLTAQYSPYGFWNIYTKSEYFLNKEKSKNDYWMIDRNQASSSVVWRLGVTYKI